ncbi:MAG: DUF4405 domain-containing protein [Clostridia bacterium]|nr:DUF4405 domain-containing protein [Clostridia bacterium]
MKKHWRMGVDIAMTVLLPLLMAYSLIGETFHEVIGTVIFALFIIHNVFNRKWYGAMFSGRYDAARVFRTVLNLLLFVFMVAQPLSGILMSKHLYTFLPTASVTAQARSVHMVLAYWGYALLCLHAGTHLLMPVRRLHKKSGRGFYALCAALGAASAYGVRAFIKRGFPGYMSGRTAFAFFDYSEPLVFFFIDYIAVMALFMTLGCLIIYALSAGARK